MQADKELEGIPDIEHNFYQLQQDSEEKIGAIAEYLCFPSQSYFTERFRRQYGMTPEVYRRENQIIDFQGTKI